MVIFKLYKERELKPGKSLVVLCDDTSSGYYPLTWEFRLGKKPDFEHPGLPIQGEPTRDELLEYLREFTIDDCFEDVCLVHNDLTVNNYGIIYDRTEFPDYNMITNRHMEEKKEEYGKGHCTFSDLKRIYTQAKENTTKLKAELVNLAQPRNSRYSRLFIVRRKTYLELYNILRNASIPIKNLNFWECDYDY